MSKSSSAKNAMPPAQARQRQRCQTTFTQPGVTKQSFKDECDINRIMARYQLTGILPTGDPRVPQFGDFTNVPDYQEALNIVYSAEDQFMELPATLRKFFNNDPGFMLAYMQDPANKAMCQK